MMCKASQINEASEPIIEPTVEVKLDTMFHFPVAIYSIKAPQFLETTREVVGEALAIKKKEIKKLNEIYPLLMTGNLNGDPRMLDLSNFIAQVSWDILDSQGYAMQNFSTYFTEF